MALSLCDIKINGQGRELLEHGTALFPIACYHDDLIKEDVPWHWHDEWEAIIVTEGTAVVAAGTEKYIVKQGEGLFINAGILHSVWYQDCSACRLHSIVFHPRLIGGSMDSIFWQNYIHPLLRNPILKSIHFNDSKAWHQEAIQAIESAWQSCVTEPFGYEFQVRSELSQLILHLSNYHPAITRQPSEKTLRNSERIKIMLQFIQEHYSSQINVSMIANAAMISESECLRCFRHTIGTSPIQYLKQFRIQKAAELLIARNDKIAAIGEQCGFQDTSYFIKSFRELKKCTPTEYRNRK